MHKYRYRGSIVEAERIDNFSWIVTGEDGSTHRISDDLFTERAELIPVVFRIMSKSEPFEEFVAIRFDGDSVASRLESLDMVRRWDPDNDWDSINDRITHILSGCGTYWIPSGYWLIYRGKEFLFHCTHEYFAERFTFLEE